MALTIEDLNNAKLDVDHIAEIATSEAATSTDRLGHTKQTLSALLADLNAQAAITETQNNRQAAELAAEEASVFGSATQYVTWAELNAVTGSGTQSAIVFNDTGTHTDPVVGGTVSNAGVYRWSASPAGWRRTADLSLVSAQADAASDYSVFITGAPVPLGGYVVEKFARVASTIRRFAYDVTGGPATLQAKVNGAVIASAVNVSGRAEQIISSSVPADATVDFWVTAGTPTAVFMKIDGSQP